MELLEACEQVRTVLDDADFRTGLLQLMAKERNLLQASGRLLDDKRSRGGSDLVDLLVFDKHFISEGRLRSFIVERAIKRLPQPPVITADELQELTLHHLSGINKVQDTHFERFLNFALLGIQQVAYGPPFSLGDWHVAGVETETEYGSTDYCSLPNGFDLNIEWVPDGRRWLTPVNAWIWGSCTEPAVNQISAEFEAPILSLIRLLKLSVTSRERAVVNKYDSERFPDRLDTLDEQCDYDDFTPPFDWLIGMKPLIALALACHCHKSEFAVRINNALTLAGCAESHPMEAIAISFCVSAIEALLCEGTEAKGEQLRARIPAVLQFQSNRRELERLGRTINALYEIRSQAVHGSRLRATPDQLQSATRLLSAVLRGALEWAVHCAGQSDLPEEQQWAGDLCKATADRRKLGNLPGLTEELSEHINRFVGSFEIDEGE